MKYNWDDFDKFSDKFGDYLPIKGEGETKATQTSTAINKLVYKWFNDGDVFDNSYGMPGWCNDISSYANWLYTNIPGTKRILDRIHTCYSDDEYTSLLYDLCDYLEKLDWTAMDKEEKVSSVYDSEGPFEFSEYNEEEDEDDYNDDYEEEEYDDEEEDL